jgi:HK97 family phage prohead protease
VYLVDLERRNFPVEVLEIRDEEGKRPVVIGYAAVWEKLSVPLFWFREKIRKGAFSQSLQESALGKRNIKALWNHNSDKPLGNTKKGTLKLEEDDKGLRFELELPDNTWGRDAEESIRRGDTDGVSFGFRTQKDEWDKADPNNVIRTLIQVELHEISPTPFAAYPQTSLGVRSPKEVYDSYVAELRAQEEAAEIEAEQRRGRAKASRQRRLDLHKKLIGGIEQWN